MHKQNVPLNLSKQVLKTNCEKVCLDGRDEQNNAFIDKLTTVKPLITNTSEEFIKCRRQFSNEFYTLLRNFQ